MLTVFSQILSLCSWHPCVVGPILLLSSFSPSLTLWHLGPCRPRERLPLPGQPILRDSPQSAGSTTFIYKPTEPMTVAPAPNVSNSHTSQYFFCPRRSKRLGNHPYNPSTPELFKLPSPKPFLLPPGSGSWGNPNNPSLWTPTSCPKLVPPPWPCVMNHTSGF